MQVALWDTVGLLESLFTSSQSPKNLFETAQATLYAPDDLGLSHAAYVENNYPVWQAVQLDGFDACMAQQLWGLMNPTRSRAASAWAFERFRQQELLKRVEGWVQGWALQFAPENLPERLEMFVVPADPANRGVMLRCNGLSTAGLAGCITATVWPEQGNLERLEGALARAFVYALRQHLHPAQTLADHLVMEGLAAVFAGQAQFNPTPWLVPFIQPEGWPDELARVAQMHGLERYADLRSNVYGTVVSGEYQHIQARPLQAEELDYAVSLLPQALQTANTNAIAAYLYGDELVAPQGHPGVGMLPLGGIEVAYWMLQNYFTRNPHELRWAIARPTGEIIWEAGYLT